MLLSLGVGPSPRLLAPGHPDWIGTDGARLGWAVRDRLFVWSPAVPAQVRMVALPDLVEDVAARPDGWVVALGQGFVTVDPTRAEPTAAAIDEEADPVTTRPGRHAGLLVEVPEHRLIRLTDGSAVPLPDYATRARLVRPWTAGVGLVWLDGDTIYRLEERSPDVPPRVAAIGRGQSVEALAVGPWGAVVAVGAHGVAVAAPRGLGTRVMEAIDGESVRFSVDGDRALAAVEDGAIEIDLATGRVTRRWAGSLLPVGWIGAEPWFLDAARAAVVDTRGEVRIAGFGGVPATRGGGWLAGPGAALWQLGQETPLRRGLVDGLVVTDGEHLYEVLGADVRAAPTHAEDEGEFLFRHDLTAATTPGLEVSDDAEAGTSLVAAHLTGDAGSGWTLHLHAEDGDGAAWHLPNGAPAGRADPPPEPTLPKGVVIAGEHEESSVKLGRRRVPLPADGVAVVEGGHWVWTDGGMLVAV